jgi:hypothetical protein
MATKKRDLSHLTKEDIENHASQGKSTNYYCMALVGPSGVRVSL